MDECDVNTTKIYHVQPGDYAYHDKYWKGIHDLRGDIIGLNKNPNLYKTHEINRHHNILTNYLDHMSLDETFLNTSENWHRRITQREMVTQKQAFLRTKEKVDDGRLIDQMKVNLDKADLLARPDNDIRETHAWAMHELEGLRTEMAPVADEAHKRVNQYCDWIGVTDRYDGYRRMLNQTDRGLVSCDGVYRPPGGPDMKYIKSASEVVPIRSEPRRWNYPLEVERAKQVDALPEVNPVKYPKYNGPGYTYEKTPAEYAGINTNFPGKTEYQRQYTKGKLDINRDPESTHYNINPTPQYKGHWELIKFRKDHYATPKTMYQERYKWPDGKEIRIPNFNKIPCL